MGGELTKGMSMGKERGGGDYLAGARAGLPFALATLVLGISFGVLARSLGWGIVAPIVFSVIAFSGSAQFAVVAVLGAGGGAGGGRCIVGPGEPGRRALRQGVHDRRHPAAGGGVDRRDGDRGTLF